MQEFLPFAAVGFTAQLIDGALGMAYGVVSHGAAQLGRAAGHGLGQRP